MIPDVQLRGKSVISVKEEAVGHGPVQEGGDHTAVNLVRIPFKASAAIKVADHAAVVLRGKLQVKSMRILLSANDTVGVHALCRDGCRLWG
jgi:hypothetical protein